MGVINDVSYGIACQILKGLEHFFPFIFLGHIQVRIIVIAIIGHYYYYYSIIMQRQRQISPGLRSVQITSYTVTFAHLVCISSPLALRTVKGLDFCLSRSPTFLLRIRTFKIFVNSKIYM